MIACGTVFFYDELNNNTSAIGSMLFLVIRKQIHVGGNEIVQCVRSTRIYWHFIHLIIDSVFIIPLPFYPFLFCLLCRLIHRRFHLLSFHINQRLEIISKDRVTLRIGHQLVVVLTILFVAPIQSAFVCIELQRSALSLLLILSQIRLLQDVLSREYRRCLLIENQVKIFVCLLTGVYNSIFC